MDPARDTTELCRRCMGSGFEPRNPPPDWVASVLMYLIGFGLGLFWGLVVAV